MAITERDETYLMDLTVLLKALREAREEAAQVAAAQEVGFSSSSSPERR